MKKEFTNTGINSAMFSYRIQCSCVSIKHKLTVGWNMRLNIGVFTKQKLASQAIVFQ